VSYLYTGEEASFTVPRQQTPFQFMTPHSPEYLNIHFVEHWGGMGYGGKNHGVTFQTLNGNR